MEKVRIGVIGLGVMGDIFSRIFKELPQAELVAVVDINEERTAQLAQELGVKGYTDYNEMLKDDEIDAVAICTPEGHHLQPVEAAARAKKHILLEKPLATTVADGEKILSIAEATGVKLMIGHSLRYDPRFIQGYASIKRGELGEIIHIRSWRETSIVNGERLGGRTSPVFFVGVHDIDILHWYSGSRVKRVYAESVTKRLRHLNTEDAIFALLKFENGVIASLETSWVLPKTQSQIRSNTKDKGMEVVGTKGMLSIEAHNIGIVVQTEQEIFYPEIMFNVPANGVIVGIYRNELEHFLRCIIHNIEPATTGRDALKAIIVASAIEESLKVGKPVELEFY